MCINVKYAKDMNQNSLSETSSKLNLIRNIVIALVAIALSLAIFWGNNSHSSSFSLEAQAQDSVAWETALSDSKPTLVEFYANWCTTCQAMAPDLAVIKQEYGKDVDFVMLNVDNSKWLPELLRYRVDGIPHFVFLDAQGQEVAQTIGEQPRDVFTANLDALIAQNPLPYSNKLGETSSFSTPTSPQANETEPRSHGS